MSNSVVINADDLSSVRLDASMDYQRDPPRPPELRQPEYEKQFDFHTLFFDIFHIAGNRVRFHGPPPLNLRRPLDNSLLSLGDIEGRVSLQKERSSFTRLRRTFRMDVEAEADKFRLAMPDGQVFEGPVSANLCHLFDGRRVLVTMIKYDPLNWVQQWVEFFVKAHGIDGVLIFNNNAPTYSSEQIVDSLQAVEDLEQLVVIDWFFPYGPGAGGFGRWDSAFTQVGALEYARYRFLQTAACVVNADVDELVFSHQQDKNLCESTEKAASGYREYRGKWACGPKGPDMKVPETERLYSNSYHIYAGRKDTGGKWSVVPSRCPESLEWGVHSIQEMPFNEEECAQLCYRNFQEFNTGWKEHRYFNIQSYQLDETMLRTYRDIGWVTD